MGLVQDTTTGSFDCDNYADPVVHYPIDTTYFAIAFCLGAALATAAQLTPSPLPHVEVPANESIDGLALILDDDDESLTTRPTSPSPILTAIDFSASFRVSLTSFLYILLLKSYRDM